MPQKKKKRDKIERIETLIELGQYDQAEAMLKDIYHPDTGEILARINALRPPKVETSARIRNKNKRLMQGLIIGAVIALLTLLAIKSATFAILMFFIASGLSFIGLRNMDADDDYYNRSQYRRAGYTPKTSSRLTPKN